MVTPNTTSSAPRAWHIFQRLLAIKLANEAPSDDGHARVFAMCGILWWQCGRRRRSSSRARTGRASRHSSTRRTGASVVTCRLYAYVAGRVRNTSGMPTACRSRRQTSSGRGRSSISRTFGPRCVAEFFLQYRAASGVPCSRSWALSTVCAWVSLSAYPCDYGSAGSTRAWSRHRPTSASWTTSPRCRAPRSSLAAASTLQRTSCASATSTLRSCSGPRRATRRP